ncbi:acid protease [Sarocladium strictum]
MRSIYALLTTFALGVVATEPAPVALTGSDWLGVDGNWSSISLRVGDPPQDVNLLVSTALSEVWVISAGGCETNDPTCINARGGVFDSGSSEAWSAMGTWQLGLDYPGYEANGEYGKDKINAHSSIDNGEFSMDGVLVSALNTTNYFNGYFGLGIATGHFDDKVADPAIVQAVKKFGRIPSYTYGFTAGAAYRDQPASLTLGGFDKARFVDHSTNFVISQSDDLPHTLVRGIGLSADDSDQVPDVWDSQELSLFSWNDSFTALIDSTTPYLWLPEAVCDQLAEHLNLTYDDNFDLYTLSNNRYQDYVESENISLTFSLSSIDNSDDFGSPLDAPGVVNISVPLRAFVGTIQYPFMGGASIDYGDPAVPYFTLRKAPDNETYVIGRSFLQEAYIVTQYDQRQFSVHQARFPKEPIRGAEIETLGQGSNSPYPGPAVSKKSGLTTGAIVGIVVGVVLACVLAFVVWFFYRRRQKARSPTPADSIDEAKDTGSSTTSSTPSTPLARLWSRLRGKSTTASPVAEKATPVPPAEAAHGEIYELPAPVPPAELDGIDESEMTGETQFGYEGEQNLSPYEQTRRKLERQLQGPVPAYSPPENGFEPAPEKTIPDLAPPQTTRSIDHPLPVSPATGGTNSNSLPNSLPSPISPRADSNGELTDMVSPVAANAPPFPPFSAHGSTSPSVCPIRALLFNERQSIPARWYTLEKCRNMSLSRAVPHSLALT